MVPRGESPSAPGGRSPSGGTPQRGKIARPKGPHRPWRLAGQLLVGVAGLVIGGGVLGLVWPPADPAALDQARDSAALSPLPDRPITVLVIGTDADRLGATTNGAAPPGTPNSDALFLVRVDPKGPVQVLVLPTELAVKLPGQQQSLPLGAVYRRGGVALTADVAAELVGLGKGQPDRYLLLSRGGLRQLVDALGSLELSPDRLMRYEDKAQKYTIDLQAGLQQLNGVQVEQLVRFREPAGGEAARRTRQQQVISGLQQQLAQPTHLARLPDLVRQLRSGVETNLSEAEVLSLLAATLGQSKPIRFASLPLEPPAEPAQALRQLKREATLPLWPSP
ncbi:LCP family protein [Cyanobium sp. ATX 6F1]|uniref:LCP family protein n=1 Tax=Cyanobium sp. ATX 6F1 TaxID=2823702 RepID=UPI0020CD8F13|nr:LCP family protein [Cyanobium sp. ATX 6F1]MCP9915905.1 LCP family protein [Cyanobium sp. ATX 6F1]